MAFIFICLVSLVASGKCCFPGSPCNLSRNDPRVVQVALDAAQTFNNQSNDSFLFKPLQVIKAQKQVIKGVWLLVDVDVSRTICRKRDKPKDLNKCPFQPLGQMHQTFRCHIEVWTVLWKKLNIVQRFFCESSNRRTMDGASQQPERMSDVYKS